MDLQAYTSQLQKYTSKLTQDSMHSDFHGLAVLAERLLKAKKERQCIYLAGNGGSAATASHMANDLVKGCRVGDRTGLRAIALTDANAVITCLANDFAYEDVFSIQLQTQANAGDLLIVFSGSGNSENIIRAVQTAKKMGITTVALTGRDGGKLKGYCDLTIIAPSDSMEQIEDMHMFYEHALVSLIRDELAKASAVQEELSDMLIGSFDIGGTKTIVAVTDETGQIHNKLTFPTDAANYRRHFAHCADVLYSIVNNMEVGMDSLLGIGVNVPGMADYKNGILLNAPFTSWHNLPIREMFRELLHTPNVYIDNDVKACALGEKYYGYKTRFSSYVWVTISTGVGAAIVIDGHVWRGKDNLAGELGHVKVEFTHPRACSCGKLGCLEAYASGTGIAATMLEDNQSNPGLFEHLDRCQLPHDAIGCASLAQQGDPAAVRVFEKTADYLARGLSGVINLINPQAVIMGGGVARSLHLLTNQLRIKLKDYAVDRLANTEIVPTLLGYDAALIGTAALVLEGIASENPSRSVHE